MHKSILFRGALLGLLFLTTVGYASDAQLAYVPGELVIRLLGDYPIDSVNEEYGTVDVQHLPQLNIYQLNAPGGGNLDSLAADIAAHPEVEFCHPNYVVDPLEPVQGSLPFGDLTGEGEYMNQGAAMGLGLPGAHDIATGSGTVVAVIDGGINLTHPAFSGQVESGWDYVDDDAVAMDEPGGENSGHGTFVAGLVHLVAPDAVIRAYRVTDLGGASNGYIVAEAILQAIQDGCRVVNLSLIMMGEHHAMAAAIQYARDNNVFVVCAAGNGMSSEAHYPASDTNVVAVAAVDSTWELADFSSWGDYVDVCAPGVNVYAPYLDTGYAWWGGTSFAAPFVTALGALIVSVDPNVTWTEVRQSILSTAIPLDSINLDYEGQLGAGLIDPLAALLAITGEASVINVPADYPTIQEAIDAAYQGDTILVAPGTYFGYASLYSKAIKLIGVEGPEVTIIRNLRIAHGSGRYLFNASGTFLPGLEIRGFTFTRGGHEQYPVMNTTATQMLLEDCIFTSNHDQADPEDNPAVLRVDADGVTVRNCLFYDNRGGPAIELRDDAHDFALIGCTIDRCDGGGLISEDGATGLYVRNTNITYCDNGPGISATSDADVEYNNVYANSPNYSGSVEPGPLSYSVTPYYLDPDHGDYRLFEGAPVVDAGDPDEIYNDPDGTAVDIGCYSGQAQPAPMPAGIVGSPSTDAGMTTSLTPTFEWEFRAVALVPQTELAVQIGVDSDWTSAEMWDYSQASSAHEITYAGAALADFSKYYGRIRLANSIGWGAWREFEFTTSAGTAIAVPVDFPTIGEAVAAASDGDTLTVAPGTYIEDMIPFGGRSVVVQSSGGADVTTIQSASSCNPVIFLDRFEEIGTTLRGFTVDGGAISVALYGGASAHVDSCLLTGAGLCALMAEDSATLALTDSRVEANTMALNAWASDISLIGNTLDNNYSNSYAGALRLNNCLNLEMVRNIVSRTAGGVGMFVWVTPGTVTNNTFVANNTYGLYLSSPKSMNVRNNIFAFNGGYGLRLIYDSEIPSEVMYNNAYGNYPLEFSSNEGFVFDPSNFSTDPIFVDTAAADYSLLPGSPCVDAGDPDPAYNDPDGTRNDIGALWRSLEYPAGSPILITPVDTANMIPTMTPEISWTYMDTTATIQQQFQLQVGSDDDWSIAEMWDTGPVSSSATNLIYSGLPLNPVGKYHVRLKVFNGAIWGEWTYATFMVKTGQLIKVPDWVPELKEGIKIANTGDTVLVGPMHYYGAFQFSDKNFVLKSSDGPEVTILEGGPSDYETIRFSGELDTTMVLDGFTLISHSMQAIEVRAPSTPKIINNIIRDCEGRGIDLWGGGGIIRGNLFQRVPWPVDLFSFHGLFEDNTIIDCGGTENDYTYTMIDCDYCSNAIFRNNLIARNELDEYGGSMIAVTSGDSILIEGNTIVANRGIPGAQFVGGAIYVSAMNCHVLNNIVAFNENLYGIMARSNAVAEYPGLYEYNDVYLNSFGDYDSISPGDGSLSIDPFFVDTGNGNYSLSAGSPCIDAGHPGFEYWDPNGSRADMGAIPYCGPVNLPVAQSISVVLGDLTHVVLPIPVFHWSFYDEGGSPAGFQIEIGTDLDWSVAEVWQSGPVSSTDTSTVYSGPPMSAATTYALRIRLSNGSSWGDWRMGLFTTNAVPSAPVALFPTDGSTVATTVNLKVAPSSDGNGDYLHYDFEVYADEALTLLDTAITSVPGDGDTLETGPLALAEEVSYWWRARAFDGYEYSDWMPTQALYTMPQLKFEEFHFGNLVSSTIECGAQTQLVFRISNPYDGYIYWLVNGFRIYSSADNAVTVENSAWYNPGLDWSTMFSNPRSYIYANDPSDEDTVVFVGINFSGPGLPAGASYVSWQLGLSISCDYTGHLVCIDSINGRYPNGSPAWAWSAKNIGSADPPWSGPRCFVVDNCCSGLRGDVDGDGTDSDIADLIYLVGYMFQGGGDPACYSEANINGDAEYRIDITDLVYLVNYMFNGGPAPAVCGVTSAVTAKIQVGEPVEIAAVYDHDSTTIAIKSPISLAGIEMELRGEGEFQPVQLVGENIELFHSRVGEVIKLGLLDIEAQTHLAVGTTELLRMPGRFEIATVTAADVSANAVYPQIVERVGRPPIPNDYHLAQNYPNPFNPSTHIAFALPQPVHVELDIYNLLGQKVVRLKNEAMAAGWHDVLWNGKNFDGDMVASGVYFYRLHTDQFTESKKMLLLK